MKNDYESIEIIEDTEEEVQTEMPKKRVKKISNILKKYHFDDPNIFEIGVDEAGRGPLFGCVYTAAVILPKDDTFDHSKMKDSKLFHSKKKIYEISEYIKENAIAWSISYEDEKVIDEINILQATQKCMHKSITSTRKVFENKFINEENKQIHLLIDGNYFNPYKQFNKKRQIIETMSYTCVEGGDNKYTSIAAASILAKVARDKYIEELCQENPYLIEKYGIDSNKGYGSKKHLDGIKKNGITIWHRRSFGICKQFV
jgi:ribonuclease HII